MTLPVIPRLGAPLLSAAILLTVCVWHAAPASAQDRPDRRPGLDTVENRQRLTDERLGYHWAGLDVLPVVTVGGVATDNLYARSDPQVRDVGLSGDAMVAANSDWAHHALSITLAGHTDRYAAHGVESSTSASATVNARIDASRNLAIGFAASIARQIEARGTTGDTLFGLPPIAYAQAHAATSLAWQTGAAIIDVTAGFDRYVYYPRHDGSTLIDLSLRDYRAARGGLRVTRPLGPALGVFVAVNGNTNLYLRPLAGQPSRNSHGFDMLGGVSFGHDRLLEGEVALGWMRQQFDSDTVYPRISGIDYAVDLHWHLTRLTSINLAAGKSLQRSPIVGVAGIEQQSVAMSAVHELLRSVIFSAGVSYAYDQFRGVARNDRYASAELRATWQLRPRLAVVAQVDHALGRNNDPLAHAREYDLNRASVALTWKF